MFIARQTKFSKMISIIAIINLSFTGCTRVSNDQNTLSITPTMEITSSPTPASSLTEALVPSPTVTPTLSATQAIKPSITLTATPTITNAPAATSTPTSSPTSTPKPTKSPTPKATATPTNVPTNTPSPTPKPTATMTPIPTIVSTATPTPTVVATPSPTPIPFKQTVILKDGNGVITDAIMNAPSGLILVVTVICEDDQYALAPNWGIGGISTDGSWGHDKFSSVTQHSAILDEMLMFKFDVDQIKAEATGDIQVSYYNGFRVLSVVLGSPTDNYKLPTPTPTPSPTPEPTPTPVRVAGPGEVEINETTFPGSSFREYVENNIDKDKDGILSVGELYSVEEIEGIYSSDDLANLKGIEYFIYLRKLNCAYKGITSLDLSQNTQLQYLDCSNNQLTSLDLSKNKILTVLECGHNQITSLDLSANKALQTVHCEQNRLTTLDVSMLTNLERCACWGNPSLQSLTVAVQFQQNRQDSITVAIQPGIEVTIFQRYNETEDTTYQWSSYASGEREAKEFDVSEGSNTSKLTFRADLSMHERLITCYVKEGSNRRKGGDHVYLYVWPIVN